jgi:hypothetical protein
MAQTYSNTRGKHQGQVSYDNFLEALRDLGKGVTSEAKNQVKQAITQDIPESLGLSSSGTLKPNESLSISEMEQQAEERGQHKAEFAFEHRLHQMREEEHARLVRQEAQTKEQITAIQQEIALLAKSTGELAKEVEVAAIQAPVNPGIYHKNFFAQLRSLIRTLRQKVQDSSQWLAVTNSRAAAKQGHYWSNVSKSGSKYMLSSERYMVTSTG